MDNYQEVKLEPINVLCVSSHAGVKGSAEVFEKLESKLPTLKGRKFYGVLEGSPKNGIYRACVAQEPGDNSKEFEKWIIPGGKYGRAKIEDWEKHIESIASIFSEIADKYKTDPNRPCIEFYKSQKELILLLPVND